MKHVKVVTTLGGIRRMIREELSKADLWARGRLKDPQPMPGDEEEDEDTGVTKANVSARGPSTGGP